MFFFPVISLGKGLRYNSVQQDFRCLLIGSRKGLSLFLTDGCNHSKDNLEKQNVKSRRKVRKENLFQKPCSRLTLGPIDQKCIVCSVYSCFSGKDGWKTTIWHFQHLQRWVVSATTTKQPSSINKIFFPCFLECFNPVSLKNIQRRDAIHNR